MSCWPCLIITYMRRLSLYIRPRLLDNTGSSLYMYGLSRKKMNLIKQKKQKNQSGLHRWCGKLSTKRSEMFRIHFEF